MNDDPNQTPEPEKTEEPRPPSWEYKTEFGINTKLKEVVSKTIDATSDEIARYRKKLDKLTYGA